MTLEKDPFNGPFDSLEHLADTISHVIDCPITIEDANHRLLAYSSHITHRDPARIETIIGRRVPEKVINHLWKKGIMQKLSDHHDPLRIPAIDDIGLGDRVAIAIRKGGDILGYIWALEVDHALSSSELETFKKAAFAAREKLLQLHVQKRKTEESYEQFFWQLLTGQLDHHKTIQQKADALQIVLPSHFQVMVFQFPDPIDERVAQLIQYMTKTTQTMQIVFQAIDRDALILLSTTPEHPSRQGTDQSFITSFINGMNDRFDVTPIFGSAGLFYSDYTDVKTSYEEALLVLQMKARFKETLHDVHLYDHLGFYRHLPHLAASHNKRHRQANRTLQKLKAYDHKHRSSLVHTLEMFLRHDSNVKTAAQALHIHTNTLNYRLRRITDIGNIDLKNTDVKISLYLDLMLERFHD